MIGIGALASLGLALPTGLAFGYGYGYGVRAGYSAFKQPSSEVQKLKLSANPVTGALGAGLQSAEERTGNPILGGAMPNTNQGIPAEPSQTIEKSKLETDDPWVYSKVHGVPRIRKSKIRTHEEYVNFIKRGIMPDGRGAGYANKARLYHKKTLNRRY